MASTAAGFTAAQDALVAVEPSAAPMAGEDYGACFLCCQSIGNESELMVIKEGSESVARVVCHKKCNSLKKRVQSLRAGNSDFEAFGEIEGAARAAFYANAANKYGADLAQHMAETMEAKLTEQHEANFKESGDFVEIGEARQLAQFKNNPEAFDRLLERAPRKKCEWTDIEYAYIPTYRFEQNKRLLNENIRARTISGEKKLKRPKALAAPPMKRLKEPTAGPALPKGILNKCDKMEGRLTEHIMQAAETLALAHSPQAQGYVGPRPLEVADASNKKLETYLAELKNLRACDGTTKEILEAKIEHGNAMLNAHIDIITKIEGALEDVAQEVLVSQALDEAVTEGAADARGLKCREPPMAHEATESVSDDEFDGWMWSDVRNDGVVADGGSDGGSECGSGSARSHGSLSASTLELDRSAKVEGSQGAASANEGGGADMSPGKRVKITPKRAAAEAGRPKGRGKG
ncbi:unnamed protein product [Prorocentrum cordatum]|uniref:Ribosome biogenesis protein NOP53 n=1 Tax=Prorocentrum cordatum TaxID=2364126 RepID=A0ABN9Q927_9DINO|nr:unnamed protein product [Polarella glacialis]